VIGVDPLPDKWRAFGWAVREIDGHVMSEVIEALDSVPADRNRPTAIIARTVKGKGVDFAEDTYLWHSNSVNDEIYAKALAQLKEPS
jgi:transketolase